MKKLSTLLPEKNWEKPRDQGISKKMERALRGLYEEARVCIRKGEGTKVTENIRTERGVRQECQLSPILFALYINDLIHYLKKIETHGPCIGNLEIQALLYADDLVLLSQSKVGIQGGLNALAEYIKVWELK